MKTQEIYNRITSTIIELLENHKENDFSQCWYSESGEAFARNIASDHTYNGINQLLLSYIKRERKYSYNRWLTFKQLSKHNAKIKKGSKAAMIVYTSAMYLDKNTGKNITKKVESMLKQKLSIKDLDIKKIPYLKNYNVFNVSCVEGLPEKFYEKADLDKLSDIERDELAEMIISGTEANIDFSSDNNPSYNSVKDIIYMPLSKQFVSKDAYYNVIRVKTGKKFTTPRPS